MLTRGVRLGDSAGTVAGGLRFNSNQLQVFTGGAWATCRIWRRGRASRPRADDSHQPRSSTTETSASATFRGGADFKSRSAARANNGAANQVRFGNVVVRQREPASASGSPSSPIGTTRRTPTSRCGRRPTAPCS